MQRLSARAEYAALAVIELAQAYESGRATAVQQIATKHNLSPRFLTNVLQTLRRASLVETIRGANGGFRLTLKPEEIALGYVIAIAERVTETTDKKHTTSVLQTRESNFNRASNSSDRIREGLRREWQTAENKRQEYLNSVLVSDLIKEKKDEKALDYTI